ncbi:poly(A) polymerase I precursor [Clostridium acetireducens DSM 10703]|uniref:Poly(A) polymerase I n=1 Tax=Clostridium acetireducens DSM 10703 TaxID=1121290 RepID=A0A1E8F1V5_9CLOT|nr:CCA tRNA nucleotidyltransferase [Clostridium acetireducens]OFI07616.1 poly(A) polymerase I precursor [Clostridium acetireducens DSM 10703]
MNILKNFNEEQIKVLNIIKNICNRNNIKAYLVGGAVRDSLLSKDIRDIDICIEEEPMIIINLLKEVDKFEYYSNFHTANVVFKNKVSVDLIRCRKEEYKFNGDLPCVTPSNIYDDLYRRDFTVNALAYDLIEEKIIDFFNGLEDLKNKKIKKIHKNSYEEDCTRIFRAIKYSNRYSFKIEDIHEIENCIKKNILNTVSNDRIIKEIYSLCQEENWRKNLINLCEYNILKLNKDKLFINNILSNYENIKIRFLNLFFSIDNIKHIDIFINNSILDKNMKNSLKHYNENKHSIIKLLSNTINNYKIYQVLKNINYDELVLLSFNHYIKYKIINYYRNLHNVKLSVNGKDLIKIGIKPGKTIGSILENLLKVKLNTDLDIEKIILKQYYRRDFK